MTVMDDKHRLKVPVTTVITITTDYPNSDGRANTEIKALHEHFTRKPQYSCLTTVTSVEDGVARILFNEDHRGDPK